MDQAHARVLLAGERARLERLLASGSGGPEAAEVGDEVDDADWRDARETGAAVDQLLRARWISCCVRGGRRWSGPRRGLPPAASAGRCAAAG